MSSYKSAMKELQAQGDEKASKRAKLMLQWSKIEVHHISFNLSCSFLNVV